MNRILDQQSEEIFRMKLESIAEMEKEQSHLGISFFLKGIGSPSPIPLGEALDYVINVIQNSSALIANASSIRAPKID